MRNRRTPKHGQSRRDLVRGCLDFTIPVPGLKVAVQFTERDLIHSFVAELFGPYQDGPENCLIEGFQVKVKGCQTQQLARALPPLMQRPQFPDLA